MGWEDRGGRRYYYEKVREGGRVVSRYVGTGPGAELAVALDDEERRERCARHELVRQERTDVAALESAAGALSAAIGGVVSASLLVAGLRPHKGQWRKARRG